MSSVVLAVMGAGSVRCTPAVVGSLASYFGERHMEIRLWDADDERLDLFDRFARLCFMANKAHHTLISTDSESEALKDADMVVFQVGENCAMKFLRRERKQGVAALGSSAMVEQTVEMLVGKMPAQAKVLSLMADDVEIPVASYHRIGWPEALSEAEQVALPHTVLRYLNGEEYLGNFVKDLEKSPLKAWLNDPSSAELVTNRL